MLGGMGLVAVAAVCWQLPSAVVLLLAALAWAALSLLLYAFQRVVRRRSR